MMFWTSATWLLTYPLVIKFGYLGVGIASAIVASTSLLTIYFVKKEIPVTVAKNIIGPLFISVIMFASMRFLLQITAESFPSLILTIFVAITIYTISALAIFRKNLISDSLVIVNSIVKK